MFAAVAEKRCDRVYIPVVGCFADALKIVFIILFVSSAAMAGAAPRARLWGFWNTHNPESNAVVWHGAWDELLSRYLSNHDGITRVDYDAFSDTDRANLDQYIDYLAGISVRSLTRDEQRALWINLYNALTVQIVLEHYPTKSIKKIPPSQLLPLGPWNHELVTVEKQPLTLNDIEHRILRPIWRDPNIHYALVCASIGCPNLSARAFTASNSERMLNRAAVQFVNHPRGVLIHDGRLRVSSIYHWYPEDFGGSDANVIAHLKYYAHAELKKELSTIRQISSHQYSWALNDKRPDRQADRQAGR